MTPSDPRPLGPLITQLRLARGWSQRRLADELCAAAGTATLTRHEVSRWERSVRVPGDRWRRQLAVVLDAPIGPPSTGSSRARRAGPGRNRRTGADGPNGLRPSRTASAGAGPPPERRRAGAVSERPGVGRAPSRPAARPDRPVRSGRAAGRVTRRGAGEAVEVGTG
ncbi:helix-turn-helix domain-containing protein [Micromonospora humida]|uniref:Helix-turn-helix transcriptional regulator n=1 Tax=Micromonospora humida TaxID=2809018 RepID=A0ABS2J0F3_9ACTN|nr:helix-turn-helix transcriptional regulator [Micromonospora humida]MBM7080008.1 helix-turn-helix transcriptional regulator [Micromonospora humida]